MNVPRRIAALMLLLFGLFASPQAAQNSIAGEWVGGYELKGIYTPLKTEFKLEDNQLRATLDFPMREETGVALTEVKFQSPGLRFELPRSAGCLRVG